MAPKPGPSSAYEVRDARKRTEPDAILRSRSVHRQP